MKHANGFRVKVSDKWIDGPSDFRLYVTTKLTNPVYSPEISARVLLLNFIVTNEGL